MTLEHSTVQAFLFFTALDGFGATGIIAPPAENGSH
jgi:hypothetical protein